MLWIELNEQMCPHSTAVRLEVKQTIFYDDEDHRSVTQVRMCQCVCARWTAVENGEIESLHSGQWKSSENI